MTPRYTVAIVVYLIVAAFALRLVIHEHMVIALVVLFTSWAVLIIWARRGY
jgi:hypothetical protein